MKTIEQQLEEVIENIGQEHSVLRYVYNNGKNFVPGVSPVYYSGPYWDNEEIIQATKTLLTGSWIAAGDEVRKFEIEFSRKFGMKNSLMVNSGSSANLVMVAATKKHLHWNDGDEVIVSVVGFPTTIAPLVQNNLVPVFVDIEMDSLNFDLNLIEDKITDKTKAIFLSPVLGNPPDMDRLVEICTRRILVLLLDDCDSLGSKWNGIDICQYSYCSTTSFYSSHILATGHGGMIFSKDSDLIDLCRSFSTWGRSCVKCVAAGNLLPNGACGHRFDNWLEGYDGIIDHKYIFENIGYKHLGNWKDYPEANKVLSHVFFIGCTPQYTEEILQYIESVIKDFK